MTSPAPAPWDFQASGKPGANGDLNYYVVDATGRKIAAVWGKREEKEATAALIIAAPELQTAVAYFIEKTATVLGNEEHDRQLAAAEAALRMSRGLP